jgi:A/G-specific adenine glycosylase
MPAPQRLLAPSNLRRFRALLLRWFDLKKRSLPWRGERDPYRILVSEIMLQQTRVAVVEPRYREFIRRFPSSRRLAQAREQSVLAAWSGLGYYRRARSLHAAARLIQRTRKFPSTASALVSLPGVGRYTAAAVASIAFGEPVPALDGNVKRVLQRLLGFPGEQRPLRLWRAAGALLHQNRPGDFNQAMMELGALVCLPRRPLCDSCPVAGLCAFRGVGARRKKPPRRKDVLHYALARKDGRVLLQQRPRDSRLMPGMWELPQCAAAHGQPLLTLRHSITTTDYTVLVFTSSAAMKPGRRWMPVEEAMRMALTGLTRKILRRI